MPASPKAVSGLVKIIEERRQGEDHGDVDRDGHVRRVVGGVGPARGGPRRCRGWAIGYMIREPGFRHDRDSEKKLTMAPMETGILKKLTP